jgi:phosphate transport system substrate-binding protein
VKHRSKMVDGAMFFLRWSIALAATQLGGVAIADVIMIGGTGSGVGTMTLLGQAIEKTTRTHTVKVVPALGTGGGIKALQGGALQVAVANRDVSAEEKASGFVSYKYGSTPFVFVTHSKAPPLALTKDKVAAIYDGREPNWPNGQTIRLVLRPANDSDTQLLMGISPEVGAAVAASNKRAGLVISMTDDDAADQIEKTPFALGASTLALVLSEGRSLNVLSLDGQMPTVAALENGSYKLAKDLYAITPAVPSEGVKQFIQFLRSVPAIDILKKTGHKVY